MSQHGAGMVAAQQRDDARRTATGAKRGEGHVLGGATPKVGPRAAASQAALAREPAVAAKLRQKE